MTTALAHIAGLPAEELLPLASMGGALWLAARAAVSPGGLVRRTRRVPRTELRSRGR